MENSFSCLQLNSDVVYHQSDKYGNSKIIYVDTTHVGKLVVTKSVNSNAYEDITSTYKYPEGKLNLVQKHLGMGGHTFPIPFPAPSFNLLPDSRQWQG